METNSIKIIDCFDIKGLGLMTVIQHFENGIPPNTKVVNPDTDEYWIIKKRVLSGTLLVANSETYFDCETEFEHISNSYKTEKDRQIAVNKELNRRKKGIYWYLLAPESKNQKVKPETGSSLKIIKLI